MNHLQYLLEDYDDVETLTLIRRRRRKTSTIRMARSLVPPTSNVTALRADVETLDVRVNCPLTLGQLRDAAYRYFAEWSHVKGQHILPREDIDADTMDRVTVNLVRHIFTTYDRDLVRGRNDLNSQLKTAVLGAIATEFPELAFECGKQQLRSWDTEEAAA